MATIANEVDKILQAAVTRTTNDPGAALLLAASAQLFKVTSGGNAPNEIVFTATPVALEGDISFSITGGTLTSITAKTATLTFANMSSTTATVTASLTSGGQTFTAPAFVAKVSDGDAGAAAQLYTWIRFADDINGTGISNDPTGKTHIGFATNKTTATESNTPGDYTWSLFKGGDGIPGDDGIDGQPTFMWVKYSDNPDGTGLYDTPLSSTVYIGIAPNKTTATESTNKADYVWSRMKGEQGVPGPEGSGARGAGAYYVAGSSWSDIVADAATPGGNVVGDRVTIWDADWVLRKYWDGDSWENDGVVIDGSLIVTGSVTASAIDTRGIVLRDDLGVPIIGLNVPLNPDYAAAGTLNSDFPPRSGNSLTSNTLPVSVDGYSAAAGGTGYAWGGPTYIAPSSDLAVFSPSGRGSVSVNAINNPATGTFVELYKNAWAREPVVAGDRYEFGVSLSAVRCNAELGVIWYNAAGSQILFQSGNAVGVSYGNAEATATSHPGDSFPRSTLIATAPAGAASVLIMARQLHITAQANPNLFASQWFFNEAGATQTSPSRYATDAGEGVSAASSKLEKNAADTLSGRIALQANGAIVAGDMVFDASGNRTSGTGSAMNQKGFVHYGPDGTAAVVINAAGVAVKADISGSTGTFGAVAVGSSMTIAAGGKLTMGAATAFGGEGVFLGYAGGTPKMSIVSGASKLLYDPTLAAPLQIINPALTLSAFTVSIGGTLDTTVSNGQQWYGNLTATVTSAEAYEIIWSVSNVSGDDGAKPVSAQTVGTGNPLVVGVYGNTIDNSLSFNVTCTIVSNGRSATASFPHSAIHGFVP